MSDNELLENIKNCKVLYIEDDSFQMEQTLVVLDLFFNSIHTAIDGEAALEEFLKDSFDLVICDIMLPKMSGVELAKKLRKIDESINLIFISSTAEISHFQQIIQMQAFDFLPKPYCFGDLKNVLLRFAKKRIDIHPSLFYLNKTAYYDKVSRSLVVDGVEIILTQKEEKIIELATQFKNKTIPYQQIAKALNQKEININAIKNIILRLRKKLPSDIFVSISGIGYRVI